MMNIVFVDDQTIYLAAGLTTSFTDSQISNDKIVIQINGTLTNNTKSRWDQL